MQRRPLDTWLDLACDALRSFHRQVAWLEVAELLRSEFQAPLAGTLTWLPHGSGSVVGFPHPTGYDLADIAGRAPSSHPLARHYAARRSRVPLAIDDVPAVDGPDAARYLAELADAGIEKHLWIPLPSPGAAFLVCGVCRPKDVFTDADIALAHQVQSVLTALQLHASTIADWIGATGPTDDPRDAADAVHLTPREVSVLALCYEGRTTKSIARTLGISPRTADKHLENAYRKLGVRERVSALRRARAAGVLNPPAFE